MARSSSGTVKTGTVKAGVFDGTTGDDTLYGSGGVDTLRGGDGNDVLVGGAGNDSIDGGTGIDIAVLSGLASGYSITWLADGSVRVADTNLADGDDGIDTLRSVEWLRFAGGGSDLSLAPPPLNAAPQAAGDRWLVTAGTSVHIAAYAVLANDSDPEQEPLRVSRVISSTGPLVTFVDGEFRFLASPTVGTFKITYAVSDGISESFADIAVTVAALDPTSGGLTLPSGAPSLDGYTSTYLAGAAVARPTAEANSWLNGTTGAETIIGTDRNDHIYDPGGADTMYGGRGDDTYDVGLGDRVIELPGEGVDTVLLWSGGAYVLPDNVENIQVMSSAGARITGNALANWMVGGTGNDVLDGGGGDDVLVGGAGRDRFIFGAGSGHDVILDFRPGEDIVEIASGFADFSSLYAAMRDTPNGALLTLPSGGTVAFSGRNMADLTARDFAFGSSGTVDLARYHLTFSSEFDDPAAPLLLADGGQFSPTLAHWGNLRSFPDNNELQTYVDASFGSQPYNPFRVADGKLTITAAPTPDALTDVVHTPYVSGVLETSGGPYWEGPQPDGFWQQYGYWEMRAQLPAGQGLWPAFWLVGMGEIDIMEALGQDTQTVFHSTHDFRDDQHTSQAAVLGGDYSTGFHTYGLLWTPDELRFLIDGRETASLDGAAYRDFGPSFMVVNLAVGGNWGGAPNASTTFPAEMQIDYIRVYQADEVVA